jgi:hypothetical protein
MSVSLSPIGGVAAQFFDNNGNVLAGGKLYSYEAGTTTPKTTYTSYSGTIANSNPIILTSAGRIPYEVWLTTGDSYKFVLTDSVGNQIGTWDNIYGYSTGSLDAQTEVQYATAGQTLFVLTGMAYTPGANTLGVYVDGVNQVVNNAYVETNATSVTFVSGLHEGATVKFINLNIGSTDASVVSYEPGFTGSVATTVQTKLRESVSVKDFGAVGDGVTDDTAAIQAAIDACETTNQSLLGNAGTYLITDTLVIDADTGFIADLSQMNIIVDASAVATAFAIGQAGAGVDRSTNFNIKLPKTITNTAKTGTGWSGFDTSVGVHLRTLYSSYIYAGDIIGFGIGLKCAGYNAGCVYNNIFLSRLYNNKINLLLGSDAGNASWTNENIFYGGEYGYDSSEGTAVSGVYDIKTQRDVASGINGPNNNLFIKPSVEGNVPEFHIYLYDASYNMFLEGRYEVAGSNGRVKLESSSGTFTNKNKFVGGYEVESLVFTLSGSTPYNTRFGGSNNNAFNFTSAGNITANSGGNTVANPHYMGFFANDVALEKDSSSTDWAFKLFSQGLSFQAEGETTTGVELTAAGTLLLRDLQGVSASGCDIGSYFGSLYLNNIDDGFVRIGQNNTTNLEINDNGNTRPGANNTYSLGEASRLWSEVFAATGTINTSDARLKTFLDIDAAEKAAALEIKANLRKFKFNEAIEQKGDAARIHFGANAQQIKDIMASHGLDAAQYGFFCYDEWSDQVDPEGVTIVQAGNRYGIRYEELLAFILSAI